MGLAGSQKAVMYALGGVARGGATRGGYVNGRPYLLVDGVEAQIDDVERGSVEIEDVLNEQPNQCRFRLEGLIPNRGDEVVLTIGSKNRICRLFGGQVLRARTFYQGGTTWSEVTALDYTMPLRGILVTAHYIGQSATAILQDLFLNAPGYSTLKVQESLPVIDEVTFTNQPLPDAVSHVLARIGGYWYCDYNRVIHAFTDDEAQETSPTDLTLTHPTLEEFTHDPDDSQVATRCYVEGRGARILSDVAIGDTMVPLDAVDMFEAVGEFAKVSPQGSSGGAQHLVFSTVVAGGAGTVVGPGVTPSTGPTTDLQAGAGVNAGAHQYAYTWVTAAGESLPSPTGSATTGVVPAPTAAPGHYSETNTWVARYAPGDTLQYAFANSFDYAGTFITALVSGASYTVPQWNDPTFHAATQHVTGVTPSDRTLARYVQIYCNQNGTGFKKLTTISIPGANVAFDMADTFGLLGAAAPAASATIQQVPLTGISIGPSGTTSRKVYRTVADGSQLKLLTTIADNTTTTSTDSTADGSLGANAPVSDTSGLTQPSGQTNPGATTLRVAGTGFARSTGGWAAIGNGQQVIRYTGFSAGALSGIPASGPGAIAAPVTFGSTITGCSMLTGIPSTGVGSIREAVAAGDELYLVVQVDDLTQQAEMASRYTTATYTDSGVRSMWVQDRRLSIAEARARGRAELAAVSQGIIGVAYTVRDPRTRSGRTVTVTMGAPVNVSGEFKIQRVSISDIGTDEDADVAAPTYRVEASNALFSLEDLLRQNRGLL